MLKYGIERISITSYVQLEEVTTPIVVPKGSLRIFAQADIHGVSALYYIDDHLVVHALGGAGTVGPPGPAGPISISEPVTTGDGIDMEEIYGVFADGTSDIVVASVKA